MAENKLCLEKEMVSGDCRERPERPIHTYSIVARDKKSGEMGIAVQSHWFSVGSVVSWGEAGVGVVATQSFVNPAFGPNGLRLLKRGSTATEAIRRMIEMDKSREMRQLAILSKSDVAAYTGKRCVPECGHLVGDNFSVQANMMLNDEVWPGMFESFESSKGQLAERLVMALEAGEEAGGDIRGRQSASLLVVRGESTGKIWEDRLVDLRVEDSSEPLGELKRLLKIHRAYGHMNQGDIALEKGDMRKALRNYSSAQNMCPENEEMVFWQAVGLANSGRIENAIPLFKSVFGKNQNWRILSKRLIRLNMLQIEMDEI